MTTFEDLTYQKRAIDAVVECFRHPKYRGSQPSRPVAETIQRKDELPLFLASHIYGNVKWAEDTPILQNLQAIQNTNHVPVSQCLRRDPDLGCSVCLDVEMETGTGKTYVYTRTILELYRAYGWDHFILSVPTIAIRQGVLTSLRETAAHFEEELEATIRVFAYDSSDNDTITKDFCGQTRDGEVHLLLLNAQKFNKAAKNIIHTAREGLGMASAASCIAKTNPIVILDEPQKQDGVKTQEGLSAFQPMVVLHYSATHQVYHELVYRLGAEEALQKGLVKQIVALPADPPRELTFSGIPYVRNISYKEGKVWVPRLEIASRQKEGGRLVTRTIKPVLGDTLEGYAGYVPGYEWLKLYSIDKSDGRIEIKSISPLSGWPLSKRLAIGEAEGQGLENELRKAQIMAAVDRHLRTEEQNFHRNIKTLTLFFIDRVEKYAGDESSSMRDGIYAKWLEEVYKERALNHLSKLPNEDEEYRTYLERSIATPEALHHIHGGYFSSDRKHMNSGDSEQERDYDAILNDKAALLTIDKKSATSTSSIRFIFSHSALREGWDNPNVFTLCFLKDASQRIGTIRQEIGRGLRICVDQTGSRQRTPESLNRLAVITTQSFAEFIEELQLDSACTSSRLKELLETMVVGEDGERLVDVAKKGNRKPTASILKYLETIGALQNNRLTSTFREMYKEGKLPLPPLSEPWSAYREQIFAEFAKIDPTPPQPENGELHEKRPLRRRQDLTAEQQTLFRQVAERISIAVRYSLSFDDDKLVDLAFSKFKRDALLPKEEIQVVFREQYQDVENPHSFAQGKLKVYKVRRVQAARQGKFDLVQDVMNRTGLSRQCICKFLRLVWQHADLRAGIAHDYDQFVQAMAEQLRQAWQELVFAPDSIEYVRTCDPQKTAFERVNMLWAPTEEHDVKTLLEGEHPKHLYEILPIDTRDERDGKGTEGRFAENADKEESILLYAKIPDGFSFPTPIGQYTPDWIVLFRQNDQGVHFQRLFFVCETKGGDKLSLGKELIKKLRPEERGRIECMQALAKLFSDEEGRKPDVYYTVLNATPEDGGVKELVQKALFDS